MKATNVMAIIVLLGGSACMAGQCLKPDLSGIRRHDADIAARQRELVRRYADEAEARGDVKLAAFYRNVAMSRPARPPGPG